MMRLLFSADGLAGDFYFFSVVSLSTAAVLKIAQVSNLKTV